MLRDNFKNVVIVTATRGCYLKLKDTDNSEELIGLPERIIFNSRGNIPEFEEVKLPKLDEVEEVEEVKEVKTTKKTSKKKK